MLKSLGFLILISRPVFWAGPFFVYWGGMIAGNSEWSWLSVWGLFFVTFPLGLLIYGLNDIADRESDAINHRKKGIEGIALHQNGVNLLLFQTISIFLIASFPFVFSGNLLSTSIIIIMVILAYAYSFQPIRLKSRPILDSLSNAAGMISVFLFGLSMSTVDIQTFKNSLPIISLLGVGIFNIHALAALVDYEVDKKIGDKTIGGFLGIRKTAVVCLVLYGAIIILLKPMHILFFFYLLLSLLLCLLIVVRPLHPIIHTSAKIIIIGFPIVCLYLFLFDSSYIYTLLGH